MRVLLDTNVWFAALAACGACSELVDYCLSRRSVCAPAAIVEELQRNLHSKLALPGTVVLRITRFLKESIEIVEPAALPDPVCRDPDDDRILAAAVGGRVDCVVTGDDDLLVLGSHEGIPILKPAEFWKFEKEHLHSRT